METFLFNLIELAKILEIAVRVITSCDRAADFARRPGFAKEKAFGLWSVRVSLHSVKLTLDHLTSSMLLLHFDRSMGPIGLVLHLACGSKELGTADIKSLLTITSFRNYFCQDREDPQIGSR